MKIALLTDGIWPFVIGGIQKHSYYLCKYLARNRVYVDLYHTASAQTDIDLTHLFSEEELEYINSFFIPWPDSKKIVGHYLRSSLQYSRDIYEVFIANEPVDLIYAQGLTSWFYMKQKEKGIPFPPICINVHGYEFYQKSASFRSKAEQFLFRPAFKYLHKYADYVYSFGGKISDIINAKFVKRSWEIIEVPNGVEAEFLNDDISEVHRPVEFVYLGRYERRKGIEELSKVIAELQEHYNFHFTFIGDIPERLQLLNGPIAYRGQIVDRSEIIKVLRDSDVLVCPSYAEGMPNVILEGMASGCAIICTDVGATSKIITRDNGWLIDSGSYISLKKALVECIDSREDRLKLKKIRSVQLVREKFIWDMVILRLLDSFMKILEIRTKAEDTKKGY